jgi:hypothetical protein
MSHTIREHDAPIGLDSSGLSAVVIVVCENTSNVYPARAGGDRQGGIRGETPDHR